MTDLTEITGGGEFTAADAEIEQALEDASDELGEPVDEIEQEVAYILDSGTGSATNEGVAGTSVGANATASSDPRLEALELYKLNNRI